MREYAQRCLRVGKRAVLLENRSRTTRENALETIALVRRRHAHHTNAPPLLSRPRSVSLTVVSNRFHMPRACRAFAAAAAAVERPAVHVRCAHAPPSSQAHRQQTTPPATGEWPCVDDEEASEEAGAVADPREVVWLALREWPALAWYALRGWV